MFKGCKLRRLTSGRRGLVTHERVVPVNLAGQSRPTLSHIFQHLGLSCTLRQTHQAKTFCRLILALLCAVHDLLASKADRSRGGPCAGPTIPLVEVWPKSDLDDDSWRKPVCSTPSPSGSPR